MKFVQWTETIDIGGERMPRWADLFSTLSGYAAAILTVLAIRDYVSPVWAVVAALLVFAVVRRGVLSWTLRWLEAHKEQP